VELIRRRFGKEKGRRKELGKRRKRWGGSRKVEFFVRRKWKERKVREGDIKL
jgi:hypothetical protein